MKIEISKRAGLYETRVECLADEQAVTCYSTHKTAYDAAREAASVLRAWSGTQGECAELGGARKKLTKECVEFRETLALRNSEISRLYKEIAGLRSIISDLLEEMVPIDISTACRHCGNCLREYWATLERMHAG